MHELTQETLAVTVRRIRAEDTVTLRQLVLRPQQALAELIFVQDLEKKTAHFGVFDCVNRRERLVGVATLYFESRAARSEEWRLRMMATHPDRQRSGIGRALLQAGFSYLRDQGACVVWCNARIHAAGFYERLGFHLTREPFEIEGVGPHVEMERRF